MAMLEEKAKNDRAVAASESTGVISLISKGEEDHEGSVSQSSSKKLKQSSLSLSATGAFSLRGGQKQTKEVPLFVGGEKGRTSTFFHTLAPWYREEKRLNDDDTVYLVYSRNNMNPIVFHEIEQLKTFIRLVDSKNLLQTLASIAKNDISTLKKASVIIFRC